MAEKYREFDVESTRSTTTFLGFKGFSFTRRELVMGILVLVFLLVIIILAALLGSANNNVGGRYAPPDKQTGKNRTTAATTTQASPPGTTTTSGSCPKDTSCYTPDCLRAASHIFELLNKSVADPCDDFYTFACGNFKGLHPLSPDESEITTFDLVYNRNMGKLRSVVEAVPSTEDPHHYESKVKTFYGSCLDHFQRMSVKGHPFLEKVVKPSGGWWVLNGDGNWPPHGWTFQNQFEKVHVDFWTDAFFTFSVGPDWLDWNKATIDIYLGGLGLGYYSYKYPDRVAGYRTYIEAIGWLLIRDANLQVSKDEKTNRLNTFVNDALYVESEMAEILRYASFETNPHALDRRPKLSDLNKNSTGVLDWVSLFQYTFNTDKILVTEDTYVVLYEQEYVQNFTQWIRNLDSSNRSRILNNYMIWRLADTYSHFLSWEYLHPYYDFLLNRTETLEFPPPWLYCLRQLDVALPDAMGALFVKDHFSDANRKTANKITHYVRDALINGLNSNRHWMSSATRLTAVQKLNASLIKIGYPKYMMNETALNAIYSSLTINKDDYFGSILSIHGYFRQIWIGYLSKPGDRSMWYYPTYSMAVEYYSPWQELIIPAGTLQFPVFDHSSPRYMNFGSMGAVVGKELTHAIDEIGNRYLLNGSHYGEWWSASTTAKYEGVLQCMMDAYLTYRMGPFPGVGRLPVSDSYIPFAISESSGVKLAFKGYQQWVADKGTEPTVPGHSFTNNQMFFISYAQTYCSNRNPYDEVMNIWMNERVTDRIRVNGALGQLQEFQETFKCPANSTMVSRTRCKLY